MVSIRFTLTLNPKCRLEEKLGAFEYWSDKIRYVKVASVYLKR
jgi:hypothetical protein